MIWRRERYIAHMQHQYTGREMFCELFGPLIGLEEEWRRQGAREEELQMAHYDWDYVLHTGVAAVCGAQTGLEPQVLEDTPAYTVSLDEMGRRVKLCKGSATIPLPLEYPVKGEADWERLRGWYRYSPERLNVEKLREQKKLWGNGWLTVLSVPGGFDELRQLMGEEELCIACYEQPELLQNMLETISDMVAQVIEQAGELVPIDCISIHEDMAGKSGPLFGPAQVRQFMEPYYRKIWHAAKQAGAVFFSQDSDGNINPIVSSLLDCGVTDIFPCEPAAGMDIVELRRKYGNRVALKGGIDKFALRGTRQDIRRELEDKMRPEMLGKGGVVFALDHRIPNGVPLENYRYYVQLGREILGLGPVESRGWDRMAF